MDSKNANDLQSLAAKPPLPNLSSSTRMSDTRIDVTRGHIHGYRILLPSLHQLCRRRRFTLPSRHDALFPLPWLDMVDRCSLPSASPPCPITSSTGFIARSSSSSSLLNFPIMLLHLLLKLLHFRAGEASSGEGGQGLMDVDGEDLEHFLGVHAVFRAEGLGVEGFLQGGREVGEHAAVPLSFAGLRGWEVGWLLLLLCRCRCGMTGPRKWCEWRIGSISCRVICVWIVGGCSPEGWIGDRKQRIGRGSW